MIEDFVEGLLKDLGHTPKEDIYQQLREDYTERVEDVINSAIIEAVPQSQHDAFSAVMDTEDGDKINAFLARVVPNKDQVVIKALADFRARIIR